MRFESGHPIFPAAAVSAVLCAFAALSPAAAAASGPPVAGAGVGAGGIALGASEGGVTDHAYVVAPPDWAYVTARAPGSFLDCGEGAEVRRTDHDGRDAPQLSCGVSITETLVVPAASHRARLIVHY